MPTPPPPGQQVQEPEGAGAGGAGGREQLAMVMLLAGAAFSVTPWCSPQLALGLGVVLALAMLVPGRVPAQEMARLLIQISVVLLGFRMDLREVLRAGAEGMIFAAATIAAVFVLGAVLKRLLKIDRDVSTLVSSGTAICGGSAIAAVGATIGASGAAMAVALATVFTLNGVALYVFPWAGRELGLTAEQFGVWAGVAIHDVSSVLGAAAEFDRLGGGGEGTAWATATVVKLSRVLWIVPVCAGVAWWYGRGAGEALRRGGRGLPIPWFVGLFLLAACVYTYVPGAREAAGEVELAARVQMRLALFLIGTGLSLASLRSVGWRALAQGVCLWVSLSLAALAVVRATV